MIWVVVLVSLPAHGQKYNSLFVLCSFQWLPFIFWRHLFSVYLLLPSVLLLGVKINVYDLLLNVAILPLQVISHSNGLCKVAGITIPHHCLLS